MLTRKRVILFFVLYIHLYISNLSQNCYKPVADFYSKLLPKKFYIVRFLFSRSSSQNLTIDRFYFQFLRSTMPTRNTVCVILERFSFTLSQYFNTDSIWTHTSWVRNTILQRWTLNKKEHLNPFVPNAPFLYSLKKSENLVFRE